MEEPDLDLLVKLVEEIRSKIREFASPIDLIKARYGTGSGYAGIIKTLLLAYDRYKKLAEASAEDNHKLAEQWSSESDKIDKALGIDPECLPKTIEKTLGMINLLKSRALNAEREAEALKVRNNALKELFITTEQQMLEAKGKLRSNGMSTQLDIDANAFENFEKEHRKALHHKKAKES